MGVGVIGGWFLFVGLFVIVVVFLQTNGLKGVFQVHFRRSGGGAKVGDYHLRLRKD